MTYNSLVSVYCLQNVGYLNKDQCLRLFEELNKYRTLPKISKEDFELIFDELDDSHDFKINAEEFDDLCHAIALKFSKEDCPSCFEYIPSVYYSPFSEKLKTFIRSETFANIIALILVINLIAVIIETTVQSNLCKLNVFMFFFFWFFTFITFLDIADSSSQQLWQVVEFVFVIGETATFLTPEGQTFLSNGEW
ncbi:Two pore calcium channel protein 1 [Bienertia sinuspersici]